MFRRGGIEAPPPPPFRFALGARVQVPDPDGDADDGEAWVDAEVMEHKHRKRNWPPGFYAAYFVRITDARARKLARQRGGSGNYGLPIAGDTDDEIRAQPDRRRTRAMTSAT